MSIILEFLGIEKSPEQKDKEEDKLWKEKQKSEYLNKRELALKEKKILEVTFQCNNCSYKWKFKYPKGIRVGYSSFGGPDMEHGWISDNLSWAGCLYDYHCPNCNENDIKILGRKAINIVKKEKK